MAVGDFVFFRRNQTFAYTALEIVNITLIVCRFGATMREDISHVISSMLHSNTALDLGRVLTKENTFDAAVLRSFLFDSFSDESDMEDFFSDANLDESFLRGFMAGLIQCLLVERSRGEVMGRPSHADLLKMYDAAAGYMLESSM